MSRELFPARSSPEHGEWALGATPGAASNFLRWFQLGDGVSGPHLYSGHVCQLFNFIFCLIKPNSILKCASFLALRQPQHRAHTAPQAWPFLPGPGSEHPQRQGRGWAGRGLLNIFFQTRTTTLFFFTKENQKRHQSLNSAPVCLACSSAGPVGRAQAGSAQLSPENPGPASTPGLAPGLQGQGSCTVIGLVF